MPDSSLKIVELASAIALAAAASLLRALVVSHRSWITALVGFAVGVLGGSVAAAIAHDFGAGAGWVGLSAAIAALGGRDLVLGVIDEFQAFRENPEGFVRRWLPWIRDNK